MVTSIAILALVVVQQQSDSAIARAREVMLPLKDSMSLRDAGFFAIGFGAGTRDLTPFQGQHWVSIGRFVNNQPVSLSRPTFVMYLPVRDSLIPIGVAYSRRIRADSAPPTDLAGTPVEWHSHVFCRGIPGEGQSLADGLDDCTARGGTPAPNQITMVHVWTVPNPEGTYAHDNAALPFLATGLTPPSRVTPEDRRFAVALGESYGAKLVVAHRIERDAVRADSSAKRRLETKRAMLRAIVTQLRAAQRDHDDARFAAQRRLLLDAYGDLAAEYRALAATPEMRARFDVELERAVNVQMHHHG
jgi:hypothetical protein